MSGDIRAKKNTKMLNKTGSSKREKNKNALHLQTSDSQEEYEGTSGMMGIDREGEFLTRKDDPYDNVEEDRVIRTKVIPSSYTFYITFFTFLHLVEIT